MTIHMLRFSLLQILLALGIGALWFMGYAQIPFQAQSAPLSIFILLFCAVGLLMVARRKYRHSGWIASQVLRLGLLGTVLGLIIAFHADVVTQATVMKGMLTAFYVTLMGLSSNIWIKWNMKLLGDVDG